MRLKHLVSLEICEGVIITSMTTDRQLQRSSTQTKLTAFAPFASVKKTTQLNLDDDVPVLCFNQ